ncbi:MAG: hypothetical protein NT016_03400 [Candidatus Aenigmarchaeota archaeon]|nr:hypothetical protein [Candidatus Aenigmarchaeota archaeon]
MVSAESVYVGITGAVKFPKSYIKGWRDYFNAAYHDPRERRMHELAMLAVHVEAGFGAIIAAGYASEFLKSVL